MKFFQKTGVAVAITVLAIAAALFIGLSPVLKSGAETAPVQTVSSQDTSAHGHRLHARHLRHGGHP